MNHKELPRLSGKRLKLRPIPRRFESSGGELKHADDLWLVEVVPPRNLRLANPRTDETLLLGDDHIHEYRSDPESDGFLMLHSEVQIRGSRVTVEPFHYRHSLEDLSERVAALEADLDESFRAANGLMIEGPSPLQILALGDNPRIEVCGFGARFADMDSTVYYNSGSISGLSPGRHYYVYAIDPKREGGAAIYAATPNRWEVSSPERIYVGRILIPSD